MLDKNVKYIGVIVVSCLVVVVAIFLVNGWIHIPSNFRPMPNTSNNVNWSVMRSYLKCFFIEEGLVHLD